MIEGVESGNPWGGATSPSAKDLHCIKCDVLIMFMNTVENHGNTVRYDYSDS